MELGRLKQQVAALVPLSVCHLVMPMTRVVATVGGAGRGRPALTISARHNPKTISARHKQKTKKQQKTTQKKNLFLFFNVFFF